MLDVLESLLLKISAGEHLPDSLPLDPVPLFAQWFADGVRDGGERGIAMPDAMALATATRAGQPSARFVLCKQIEPEGAIHFFTNYNSRKSAELIDNPRAAGVFYWPARARQARVEGAVDRLSDAQNDAYFATRPLASKIGAWASRQSEPLESRRAFVRDLIDACRHLRIDPAAMLQGGLLQGGLLKGGSPIHVPRPPHWGGFRLRIERIELWCGAEGRLHDRAEWARDASQSSWRATRLYP